jgi:hypothetical protein
MTALLPSSEAATWNQQRFEISVGLLETPGHYITGRGYGGACEIPQGRTAT